MRKIILALSVLFLTITTVATAQKSQKLPSVDLKTVEGKAFNNNKISNGGKPVIISFWATWCAPCKKELNAIAEVYEDWQKQTGVKLYAVSIDDSKSATKVAPYVNGKGWEYIVLLDQNQDFKRAMNVNNVPHTFVLDGKGQVVWQSNTYTEGGEAKLLEVIKKVAKGEKVD